ncbi:MAG: hypothetical protein A2Z16_11690 [Chloroflexi bacterium RBG_16_54_18]|nr:MAG: hypothetical protein A2Z16_11690 [Chloroflexi bacterium RBG_16_54_18]
MRKLENQLEAVQDELTILDRRLELVKSRRIQLEALAGQSEVFATALASGEMDVETQMKLFASLQKHAGDLDTELGKLQGERRGIERRLEQLKNQLEQINSSRPPERFKAAVEVDVSAGGRLNFQLSYTVAKAGWKPLYDLRLSDTVGKTQLEAGYLAQVTQLSGEDWVGVELSLSTARPALATILPELKPWFIQPQIAAPVRPALRNAAALPTMDMTMSAKAVEEPVEEAVSKIDGSGASITYHTAAKVDIPSDGSAHKVTIGRFALKPDLDYVSSPRLVEAVYRKAKLVNESDYLLLPGTANLFSGEEFIGSTALELTTPQGEIELYLGVEDRIRVERELKRREVDKSLIGGKRRVHYGYELKLENLLPSAVHLTVHDQMPVGRHEDIKVKLEAAVPKPQEPGELNLLDWELDLAPKEKKTIRFDFQVEYPQEMRVMGLP